ncbi:hypothetical protein BC940DRAFT_17248 [Gongronella butleri]|nr:hypothetical protein BC940DRAFT_17248 [Gongronella butleri]
MKKKKWEGIRRGKDGPVFSIWRSVDTWRAGRSVAAARDIATGSTSSERIWRDEAQMPCKSHGE